MSDCTPTGTLKCVSELRIRSAVERAVEEEFANTYNGGGIADRAIEILRAGVHG